VQVPPVGPVEHVPGMMVDSLMISSEYTIIATDVMPPEHVAVIGPIVKPSLTDSYVLQEGSPLESKRGRNQSLIPGVGNIKSYR
jgi:hypothetical protein